MMKENEVTFSPSGRNPGIRAPGITLILAAGVALFAGTRARATQTQAVATVPENALVIIHGTVITGTGAGAIQDGVVVLQGDRILSVGPETGLRIPEQARIVDAGGGTILPGVINAHVHHSGAVGQRRRFLEAGVTTVCDVGSPTDDLAGFDDGEAAGGPAARGFFSGPIITAPGGYPDGLYGTTDLNREVRTPLEGRRAVADLLGRGASYIKIALDPSWDFQDPLPVLDLEVTAAIVEEAHSRGARVRSHQIQIPNYPPSMEAGVDVAEHLPFPTGWPPEEEILDLMKAPDPLLPFFEGHSPSYDALLTGMAERGMAMVPTVSTLLGPLYGKKDSTKREEFLVGAILGIVRRFRDAGGIVALGNDFNDGSVDERMPLKEMKALRDAGLTPMEVMEASTRHAAFVCGQEADLGTLEAGKLADILIVDGDPLMELDAMRNVRAVILGGVVAHGDVRLTGVGSTRP